MKNNLRMCSILAILCIFILGGCTTHQDENDQIDSSVDMALEQAVSDAIISHNKVRYRGGDKQMFATEYHEVLKTVVNDNYTEVYLATLYAQYQYEDGEAELTGGGSNPCVITFVNIDSMYSVTDYWEPEDGENYESSLRGRFPEDILESGTDLSAPNAMEICNQRAIDYFEG